MKRMVLKGGSLVVIGASAGGVTALLDIAAALPRDFPAPVCIVQHVGARPSVLPELLRHRGPNHAMHARDGDRLLPGVLHVAPPDHHMLVDGPVLRLTRGAKEHYARPAIDPLFCSAAASWGPAVIGVVLTGQLEDGTAGLKAIKHFGGIAVVQDPRTAMEPAMPASALRHLAVDHCVRLQDIPALLLRLAGFRSKGKRLVPAERLQHDAARDGGRTAGRPAHAVVEAGELPLWTRVRVLREREMLLRRLGRVAAATGDWTQATAQHAQADALRSRIGALLAFAAGLDEPHA